MDSKITCEQVQELLDDYGLADLDDVRFVLDQYQKVICNCTKLLSKITYDADVVIEHICDTLSARNEEEQLHTVITNTVIDLKEKVSSKKHIIVLYIPFQHYSKDELMQIYNCISDIFPTNHIIALPDDVTLEICQRDQIVPKLQKLINRFENKN